MSTATADPLPAESAHARYRRRLEALARPGTVAGEVAAALPALRGRRDWRYPFTRFNPGSEPYARLLLESREASQELVHVDVHDARPPSNGGVVVRAAGIGWLSPARFPDDPALAGLSELMATPGAKTVMRYRPLQRCTLRVEQAGQVRFAKLFADHSGESAHAAAVAVHQAGQGGELCCDVPRPLSFDAGTGTLWLEAVPGTPAAPRLYSRGGAPLARRMGLAAASLTRSGLRPRRSFDRDAQLALSMDQCAELRARVPALAPALRTFLELLLEAGAAAPVHPLRPIHGDLDPSQWLATNDSVGLVDFERLALGDPELDVATFLTEVESENPRRAPIEQLGAAFLAGFESVSGPLDRGLLRLYRAQRRLHKALRASQTLRPDGDRRAEKRLSRAIACLEEPEVAR